MKKHRTSASILLGVLTVVLGLTMAPSGQSREGLLGELLTDIAGVEKKVLGLARAMPDSAYAWRPAPGVRSTAEVFQHIAADNYFLPVLVAMPAPKETGITKDYKTVAAYEKRTMTRDEVIAELEKSFAFLRTSMGSTTDAQLNASIDMFGQKSTTRGLWLTTATHLHEHLGQLIAYARANKVTPPWSK
jgi:uncharacterized damage-inducible protein DinB